MLKRERIKHLTDMSRQIEFYQAVESIPFLTKKKFNKTEEVTNKFL